MNRPMPDSWKALAFNAQSRVIRKRYDDLPRQVADRSQALIDEARFSEAVALAQQQEGWASTYLGRLIVGNCLHGSDLPDDSDREYEAAEAIVLDVFWTRMSVLRNNRAMNCVKRKDYDGALRLCDESLDFLPSWVAPWVTKLSVLNLSGRQDGIESVFADMDRRWPQWRTDTDFAERCRTDPHMTGIERRMMAYVGSVRAGV